MTRSKSTYKFYSPIGIISLVLGILIWYVVLVDFGVKKKNEYILHVVMFDPTDTLTEGYPEIKSLGCFGNELIKKLQFTEFELTANDSANKVKLDQAQNQIRSLVQSKDTTKGIHFHLQDGTTFNDFIQVINICKKEKIAVFLPYQKDIWVMNQIHKGMSESESELVFCGTK
jgi:hypothetical protein